MPKAVDIDTFLALRDEGLPILDARSPGEFARGHVPGAFSTPLFDDAERAAVGTAYAREGRAAAVARALALIGGELEARLAAMRAIVDARDPGAGALLHCWRGGMRSGALSWLLEAAGYRVRVLAGGYRAYRTHVRRGLAEGRRVIVVGGFTGCGKTDILHALGRLGEQIIDLEGLAVHRGSAFGHMGPQPRNEDFENMLFDQWRALDPDRVVWLEDESLHIGSVTMCAEFFAHLAPAPMLRVALPREARLARLVRMYASGEQDDLLRDAFFRIRKRLGLERAARCTAMVDAGDHASAAAEILDYYDKGYACQMSRRDGPVTEVPLEADDPDAAARRLVALSGELGLRT